MMVYLIHYNIKNMVANAVYFVVLIVLISEPMSGNSGIFRDWSEPSGIPDKGGRTK
jgi:hypothetical protein